MRSVTQDRGMCGSGEQGAWAFHCDCGLGLGGGGWRGTSTDQAIGAGHGGQQGTVATQTGRGIRGLLSDTGAWGGGGVSRPSWAFGRPPPPNQQIFPQGENEDYYKGQRSKGDFRTQTLFFFGLAPKVHRVLKTVAKTLSSYVYTRELSGAVGNRHAG